MENRAIFTQKSRMVGLFVLIILAILCLAIGAGMRGVGVSAKNTQDIIQKLKAVDINTLTPLSALNILCELREQAKREKE